MKIHQSSLNLYSSSFAQNKTGKITVSSAEKQKILQIQAVKDATEQSDKKPERNTNFSSAEIERLYTQSVNLVSFSQQSFENNIQLNAKSLKAISAYINERNQPEQEKLASLMIGFDITV